MRLQIQLVFATKNSMANGWGNDDPLPSFPFLRHCSWPGAEARSASGRESLRELEAVAPEPAAPAFEATMRAALQGVRVLDLCIILAGPTLGRTLGEFGADVIKIDNPSRGGFVSSHNDVNRGKRSLLLDLKSDVGRDIFWRLWMGQMCGEELSCRQVGKAWTEL